MKTIVSGGGPLIAVRPMYLPFWGGIDCLKFFENRSSRANDYEALCDIVANDPYRAIDIATGPDFDIFLIVHPLRIFIVDSSGDHIYIAQIETSEAGWSDDQLKASDFEVVTEWNNPNSIFIGEGPLVFFNSGYVESDLRDYEIRVARLNEGTFLCEWSSQFWPSKARMNFIRVVKQQI